MKKILSLIILLIVLTSCLAKVDLEKDTGSLSINIGANTSQKSNISRAISSDTTKIYINLFQPSTHTEITREIAYTQGQSYNLTIDNLTEGVWDLHISTYNEISTPLQTGEYSELIEIYSNKNTLVSHKFGAPKKIQFPSLNSVQDREIINGSRYLSVDNPGNSLNDSLKSNNGIIYISDKSDFTNILYTTSFILDMSVHSFSININDIMGSDFMYQYDKTYYWKVVLSNDIGTTESKVFSFTTEIP